jgi:hypothetical protein
MSTYGHLGSFAIASLSATQVGFFSTVALVIPVFIVAYVIGIEKAVTALGPLADSGWLAIFLWPASGTSRRRRPARAVDLARVEASAGALARAALRGVIGLIFGLAAGLLLMAAVALPGIAEYAALHALYVDHAAPGDEQFCLIWTIVAGSIVIVPLTFRGLLVMLGFNSLPQTLREARRADQLERSWTAAAQDLGITVEQVGAAVVVHEFGSRQGMLCTVKKDSTELKRAAEAQEMGFSALGEPYLSYNRGLFEATLNDWQWCGTATPPSWYTGAALD